jgi:phytoene dehydrogenase-like protein
MRYLDLAARPARYGESAKEPLIEATIPSLVDPDLVQPRSRGRGSKVKHVMSAVVQAVATDAGNVGDTAARTIEAYAPGFTDLIEERQVLAPADIEREYGNSGGHPMHAEVALDQWFEWRPLHGLGRHRMPLDGLYLCGSGAHPGGGVTGGPGRNAAQQILSDKGRSRRKVVA